jgi:Flp pilus assembly pilin Flp
MTCRSFSFWKNNDGLAAVEMALLAPLLITLLLGIGEVGNYILVAQRTDRVAHMVADITAQGETVSVLDLKNLTGSADALMAPYPFTGRGRVVVTSVHRGAGDVARIAWQYVSSGTLAYASGIGTVVGAAAVLPTGFTVAERDTVIVAEVFYDYPPLFAPEIRSSTTHFYKTAFYKPRLGALDSLSGG